MWGLFAVLSSLVAFYAAATFQIDPCCMLAEAKYTGSPTPENAQALQNLRSEMRKKEGVFRAGMIIGSVALLGTGIHLLLRRPERSSLYFQELSSLDGKNEENRTKPSSEG